MRSQLPLLSLWLSLALMVSLGTTSVQCRSQDKLPGFTLQVAAFPESAESQAEEFLSKLTEAGEQPIWGIIEIRGRGLWTRVFIGIFTSALEARQYGETLITRGLIEEFLVKRATEIKSLSRPRSINRPVRHPTVSKDGRLLLLARWPVGEENLSPGDPGDPSNDKTSNPLRQRPAAPELRKLPSANRQQAPEAALARPPTGREQAASAKIQSPQHPSSLPRQNQAPDNSPPQLDTEPASAFADADPPPVGQSATLISYGASAKPITVAEYAALTKAAKLVDSSVVTTARASVLRLAPPVDLSSIPRCDPVRTAFSLLANVKPNPLPLSTGQGGLWLSGDIEEALLRLRWIAGSGNEELLLVEDDGRVQLNLPLLASRAGVVDGDSPAASLRVVDFILSNEGVLLLVQLTQSAYRYKLHMGNRVATFHGVVTVNGSINLDTNFDSRINPYRRLKKKLHTELPPFGFDSLIAINPAAQWFNTQANRFVQVGNITFHELVEAYAKVELEYEYLPQGALPGAHNTAIEREIKLKAQRPFVNLVLTIGSNRVITSDEELRQLTSEINDSRQN